MYLRTRIKTLFTIAVVTIAFLASTSIAVDVVGELGILDVTANGGINPNTGVEWQIGDEYRLAFHTLGKIDATSNDPEVYNAFATSEAGLAGLGGTWFALVTVNLDPASTEAASPKSNPRVISGTDDQSGGAGIGGAGVPVYAMDGTTCIARNNADIWNNWSNPFDGDAVVRVAPPISSQNVHYSPFLDQYGNQTVNPDDVHGMACWSGMANALGSTSNIPGDEDVRANYGNANANNPGRIWNRFQTGLTSELSVYAISDVLTMQDANADPNRPSVDAGDSWITWSGQAVDLAPVVVNNDTENPKRTLSYVWTADPADGVAFTPNANVEAPAVTTTKTADTGDATVVTLTLTVTLQDVEPVAETMTVDVYDDACAAAVAIDTEVIFDPADFNKDCITDIEDIMIMAIEWLVDYSLTAPSVSDSSNQLIFKPTKILALSDMHLTVNDDDIVYPAKVIEAMNDEGGDLVLVCGDLGTNGLRSELELARGVLDEFKMPYYPVVGNHDALYSGEQEETLFSEIFNLMQNNYHFVKNGIHFIAIDHGCGKAYRQNSVRPDVITWINDTLKNISGTEPIVFFSHYPFGEAVTYQTPNADEVLALFKDKKLLAMVSGHFHGNTERRENGILMTTTACSSGSRGNHDGTEAKGYRVFHIDNQMNVTTEFKEVK